jgi:hypothetical protein
MAKFYGRVGFGETIEESPGVYTDEIVEHHYFGEVVQNSRGLQEQASVNPAVSVGNSIQIVGNAYAHEHFFAMRYVEWGGVLWTVANVEVQRPRLLLRLGEVYNGPTAAAP